MQRLQFFLLEEIGLTVLQDSRLRHTFVPPIKQSAVLYEQAFYTTLSWLLGCHGKYQSASSFSQSGIKCALLCIHAWEAKIEKRSVLVYVLMHAITHGQTKSFSMLLFSLCHSRFQLLGYHKGLNTILNTIQMPTQQVLYPLRTIAYSPRE